MRIWHWPLLLATLLSSPALAQPFAEVNLTGRRFEPQELRIPVGTTVLWRNRDGFHNIVADDGSFSSGAPSNELFGFEHTFDEPGIFGYHCEVHGAPGEGMHGRIIVQRDPNTPVDLDASLAGSWFNPATDGQGFLVEIAENPAVLALAWFTWGENGAYDWLTAAGSYQGPTATLSLSRARGGAFNAPTPVQFSDAGTAIFRIVGCDSAEFSFNLTDPPRSGTIPLRKLIPDPLCTVDGAPAR